jgi:hypothetical protein
MYAMYYASMLQCWQLIRILVRTNHACLRVRRHTKVGLRMLPLSRLDPLLSEFPPFMIDVLEVVDSSAESPKCVATQIGQEPEALV